MKPNIAKELKFVKQRATHLKLSSTTEKATPPQSRFHMFWIDLLSYARHVLPGLAVLEVLDIVPRRRNFRKLWTLFPVSARHAVLHVKHGARAVEKHHLLQHQIWTDLQERLLRPNRARGSSLVGARASYPWAFPRHVKWAMTPFECQNSCCKKAMLRVAFWWHHGENSLADSDLLWSQVGWADGRD